jgi:osmotically-inducible protein OsmY
MGVIDRIDMPAGATPPAETTDAERRGAIERALAGNPNLARYLLAVEIKDGQVVLKGRVRTGAERDLAGLLARDAAGGAVVNAIVVGP